MRELLLGPKRFGDLRASLPGISANVLTQRLEGLEASGIVVRHRLPPPAAVQVYELTPWGYESEPIFCALGRWAVRSPAHDPTLPLSAVSLMLSFRTMFDAASAGDAAASLGFRIGDETYRVDVRDGALSVARGPLDQVSADFAGPAPAIAAAIYGAVPLADLERDGALSVGGDREIAGWFTRLFPLPPKAAAPRSVEIDDPRTRRGA